MFKPISIINHLLFVLFSFSLLLGCSKENEKPDAIPTVEVIKAESVSTDLSTKVTGRLEAYKKAEIRARVPGVLKKILFQEGSYVKAGQLLFVIDDAPYQAVLKKASANLLKTKNDFNRYAPLLNTNAISKLEYDTVKAAYQAAQADFKSAQVNLSYAHILAPISGKVGGAIPTEGALVGQIEPTLMATIQDTSKMHILIEQSASELLEMRKAIDEGRIELVDGNPEVSITLEGGATYPIKGKLLYTDATVNENTGQVSLKAEIDNPDHILLPGLYVDVNIYQAKINDVFIIPNQAVTRNQQGNYVIVVNKDGTYQQKPVTVVQGIGNNLIVSSGIKTGDMVMVDGFAKLMLKPKTVKTQIVTLK